MRTRSKRSRCTNRKRARAAALALVVGALSPALVQADFVPGFLYVSDTSPAPCFDGGPPDQIWEVNPRTGESRVFATLPPGFCGGFQGLAFTPDGQYLRVGSFWDSQVLQIDGDGNFSVALGPEDGLNPPNGFNGLAYDAEGNFFVSTVLPSRILKFPADGGPPSVFANRQDGIESGPALAFAPAGELYATNFSGDTIRFQPDGDGDIFTTISGVSIAVDASNNVYLRNAHGLYRFINGDPADAELMLNWPPELDGVTGTITVSPDQQTLMYVALNEVRRIDLLTGAMTELLDIPGYGAGHGSVFYVPEPNAVLTVSAIAFVVARGRRVAGRKCRVSRQEDSRCDVRKLWEGASRRN